MVEVGSPATGLPVFRLSTYGSDKMEWVAGGDPGLREMLCDRGPTQLDSLPTEHADRSCASPLRIHPQIDLLIRSD